LITLANLEKSYGDRTLFECVTLRLDRGHRYGLVGANGSGKTTLLQILAGEDSPSDGEVTRPSGTRIGILRQDRYLDDSQRILDVAMMGDEPAWSALVEQERLVAAAEPDPAAIAAAAERIEHTGGYSLAARAGAVLEGLGIPAPQHRMALGTLSGGFKLRVLLGQTLLGQPDLLLLDEPTNHLDIVTVRWFEELLAAYPGCVVVISHDHRFLDNVASDVLDIDYGTITAYVGNYSRFVVEKQKTRERKETEIERQRQIIEEKKAFVERFRAKNTKARQAQSKLKQIERIEIEELPPTSREKPHFRFEQARPSGKEVLAVEGVAKSYGDKRVLAGVSLALRRGERVGIIGANGLGKSTLLKILVGSLPADRGETKWGYETNVGYFPQDHRELLGGRGQTVLDYLWDFVPKEPLNFVRGELGRLLFSGEDVKKPVSALSGGEAARLIFSRIVVQKPNVLVLDEPTNHLDLESIEALVEALDAYEGTLVFVSHDRFFVQRLAQRIIEVTAGGLTDYPGTYDDFVSRGGGPDHLDHAAVLERANAERTRARAESRDGGGWEEKKRKKSEHRKLVARRDRVTALIEEAEKRQREIEALYCQPGFFEDTPRERLAELEREKAELGPRLDQLLAEWEALETAISAEPG
jgi:ATPase subunit of ABC transporter with duplicated ATPase domains